MSLIPKRSRGFTLIEILIAMAIFTLLGLASSVVLTTVLNSDESTQAFSVRLKGLQQGFSVLERDLGQMVARTPRTLEGGRANSVFQSGDNMFGSDSQALVFYRLGWLNPQGILPRGNLQSVAYVVQDGRLERWHFPYPEPDVGAEPEKVLVIDDVITVEYSFYSSDKWQQQVDATRLPEAIAIAIEIEGLGWIERRFLLPKGQQLSEKNDSDSNGDNDGDNENSNGNNNNGSGSDSESNNGIIDDIT